jgi:hypothetical protein
MTDRQVEAFILTRMEGDRVEALRAIRALLRKKQEQCSDKCFELGRTATTDEQRFCYGHAGSEIRGLE